MGVGLWLLLIHLLRYCMDMAGWNKVAMLRQAQHRQGYRERAIIPIL